MVARLSDPIIPYPTGRFPFSHLYQAINCLATIGKSLRDKRLTAVHEIEAISLRLAGFEHSGSTELAEVLSAVAFA
jgi:hypothetical protein